MKIKKQSYKDNAVYWIHYGWKAGSRGTVYARQAPVKNKTDRYKYLRYESHARRCTIHDTCKNHHDISNTHIHIRVIEEILDTLT